MKIVDKRVKRPNATFGDLSDGEVFLDEDNDICIKINDGQALYYINQNNSWKTTIKDACDEITIIKATLTIENM